MRFLYLFCLAMCLVVVGVGQPSISSFSPTSGAVGTLITITGNNLNNLTSFNIGGTPAIVVSDNGNTLVGMVMPGASSGNISLSNVSGSANSLSNFNLTQTLYPSVQEGNKLMGTGAIGHAYQGNSVDLSADGNTAIIGGMNDDASVGAAWIFVRNGNSWSQQGTKLIGTGSVGSFMSQGMSVALSADGNTAIIGGPDDDNQKGAAWIFVRNGNTWTQQGNKLIGTGASGNSYQGSSVALSADGNTAVVSGTNDNISTTNVGSVWVYKRTGNTWTQQGNKLNSTGTSSYFGGSVALSADGSTIIVGDPTDNNEVGATWIFVKSGNVWIQQGSKLIGSGAVGNARQGTSVALNADGNTAVIGGPRDNNSMGAVWIFNRSGSVWTQQGNKLTGTTTNNISDQGNSVAMSADGNTIIVGGPYDGSFGASWIFARTGGVWTQMGGKLIGTTNSMYSSRQGMSVSLSADGSTAIVGGQNDDNDQGASWIFVPSPQIPTNVIEFIGDANFSVYPNPSNGLYTINVSDDASRVNYTITSIDGSIIEYKGNILDKSFLIDLNTKSSGVYFMKIESSDCVKTFKLVKQ